MKNNYRITMCYVQVAIFIVSLRLTENAIQLSNKNVAQRLHNKPTRSLFFPVLHHCF